MWKSVSLNGNDRSDTYFGILNYKSYTVLSDVKTTVITPLGKSSLDGTSRISDYRNAVSIVRNSHLHCCYCCWVNPQNSTPRCIQLIESVVPP